MSDDEDERARWDDPGPIPADELRRTADLLNEVFPDHQWHGVSLIDHWYNRSPVGHAVPFNVDDGVRRLIHVGAVPMRFRTADGPGIIVIMQNSSASRSVQRSGRYAKLLQEACHDAGRRGATGIFGVANAASTPAALTVPGITQIASLPVRICAPRPSRVRARSVRVDSRWFDAGGPEELAELIDVEPRDDGWVQEWTAELLRWRLSVPGGQYAVHLLDDLVGVSTLAPLRRLKVPIVLRAFPTKQAKAHTLHGGPLVTELCRFYRRPVAIHGGLNDRVRFRGIRIPPERLPSPLNVLYMSGDGVTGPEKFRFASFEFLDFDTY